MANFKQDILFAADGKPIKAVVIGDMGWQGYGANERHAPGLAVKGKTLTWEEAAPLLDYEYETGYGAPDCQAITVWTTTDVLFVVQYDGSTNIYSIPRRPVAYMPEMPGG